MRRLLLTIALILAPAIAEAQPAQPVRLMPAQGLLLAGQKTTDTSASTSEVLASSVAVVSVSMKAACANTVSVHVGPAAVRASGPAGRTLAPCETLDIDAKDPAVIFLDSGTTAATVEYLAVQGP